MKDIHSGSQVFAERESNNKVRTRPAPKEVSKVEDSRGPRVLRSVKSLVRSPLVRGVDLD